MTPDSWKKIGDLVEQALTYKGQERQHFLEQACKDDPEMRKEVDLYISTYEANIDFLEKPAIEGLSFQQGKIPLRHVGPYRIVKPLGKGGMGEVFLAQREDGPMNYPVALKLIKTGLDDADFMLIRFQIEQQILSELTHPHIARMLDAGTAEDGRPYFVMEFVDGIPLTDYCDQQKLGIDARLKLFLQVCDAVQFAHQNLIVHRDLKPGNLLVTSTGEVKLLDFGIAKALSPWLTGVSAMHTQTGFRVLTPVYASPEQVKGNAVSTASDVYSLGVLLFELLTGHRPYRIDNQLEAEVVRVITEESPPRPSVAITQHLELKNQDGSTKTISPENVGETRQTTVERLQRKLKGELDNIVLMALRKESTRRYSSASGLGEDIRRHLEGLPVEAQPDTLRYRAGKFVRRHQWGVAAASLISVLLVGFSTVTFVQSSQIRAQSALVAEERDRAEEAATIAQEEAKKSEKVVQILVDLFGTANPVQVPGGDTLRVGDFLAQGEEKVLQDLAEEPEIQAEMRHVIGKMYQAKGDVERAMDLIEAGLFQQRALKGAQDISSAIMLKDLALLHNFQGRRDTALVMLQEVEATLRMAGASADPNRADVLLAMAPLLPLADFDKKERMLVDAGEIIEGQADVSHMKRASVSNQLGVFYYNQGKYEEALEPFENSVYHLEQAVGRSHPYSLVTTGNLAGVYSILNKLDEAEALHRQVLEQRRLDAKGEAKVGTAFSLKQLGDVYINRFDWQAAEKYMAEAHEMITEIHGEENQAWPAYAMPYASVLVQTGKFEKAERLMQASLQIIRKYYGEAAVEYALARFQYSILLHKRQEWAQALENIDSAMQVWLDVYPDEKFRTIASARILRGVIHIMQGNAALSIDDLKAALNYRTTDAPNDIRGIAEAQVWLGVALSALGRQDEAKPLFVEVDMLLSRKNWLSDQERTLIEEALQKASR